MYPATRIFLKDDNGDKFFGEGPCRLLKGIERTGSLRAAAQEMDMAYTKALHLIKHAEEVLGFPLTQKSIGGKGGGGADAPDRPSRGCHAPRQHQPSQRRPPRSGGAKRIPRGIHRGGHPRDGTRLKENSFEIELGENPKNRARPQGPRRRQA